MNARLNMQNLCASNAFRFFHVGLDQQDTPKQVRKLFSKLSPASCFVSFAWEFACPAWTCAARLDMIDQCERRKLCAPWREREDRCRDQRRLGLLTKRSIIKVVFSHFDRCRISLGNPVRQRLQSDDDMPLWSPTVELQEYVQAEAALGQMAGRGRQCQWLAQCHR